MAKVSNPGGAAKMTGKKATPKKAAASGMNKTKASPRYPSTAGSMVPSKKDSGTTGGTQSARQARQQSMMQGRTSGRKVMNPQGGNF